MTPIQAESNESSKAHNPNDKESLNRFSTFFFLIHFLHTSSAEARGPEQRGHCNVLICDVLLKRKIPSSHSDIALSWREYCERLQFLTSTRTNIQKETQILKLIDQGCSKQ